MSEPTLDELAALDFGAEDPAAALEGLGRLIDGAEDVGSDRHLSRAIEAISIVHERDLRLDQQALLHYFEGNAWSAMQRLAVRTGPTDAWDWNAEAQERRIIAFRKSVQSEGFESLGAYRCAQVLTNLGSVMSNVGRFVEALEYWGRAVSIEPRFGMAIACMGQTLIHYVRCLYDAGHREVLLKKAHSLLEESLCLPLEAPAPQGVREQLDDLVRRAPPGYFGEEPRFAVASLGRTRTEREYREWCLRQRLFVNPLNDLYEESFAACDVLNLPSITVRRDGLGRARGFVGFFGAIKQEYVAARRLLFESVFEKAQPYSDRYVFFQDTLDHRALGIRVEQAKTSFRMAYSVLDKVATFLNEYLTLDIAPHQTHFRTLWYQQRGSRGKPRPLREEFEKRPNWPLRGLYWLSKDLDSRGEPGLHDSLEPDAKGIADLRNALEHGYVAVTDGDLQDATGLPPDELATMVELGQLERHALRMLRKARAALMYLSMAVQIEEAARRRAEGGLVLPIEPGVIRHVTPSRR